MNQPNPATHPTICKIVCFDEGSATDYIQVVNGGETSTIKEKASEREASAKGEIEAKAGLKTKLIEILTGIDISAEATGAGGISFNTSAVAKSIISNTVLTDFLEAVGAHEDIRIFEGFDVVAIENSLASYALMTPYLSMLRGGNIPAGDFNLALDKLDSTIKDAKGYYEFLGIAEEERVVFRFNRESFKNNYKVTDLLRMSLIVYAVEVGTCRLADLDVSNELNMPQGVIATNPDYEPPKEGDSDDSKMSELKVYDVLLAGVRAHG